MQGGTMAFGNVRVKVIQMLRGGGWVEFVVHCENNN